jgi:hypothetical protein
MSDDTDLTQLGDPEFLAERRRVRQALEHKPTVSLTVRYEQINEEFLRRVRIACGGDRG